jgi:hypothetical protein
MEAEHKTQVVPHGQFLLRKLALVRRRSLKSNHRKSFTLLGICTFHGMYGKDCFMPGCVIIPSVVVHARKSGSKDLRS